MTPAHPPIVLVGGAPGSEKTTLAKALALRLVQPSHSFDHVVAGIRAVTTPEGHPAFHAGRSGHVDYFTERTPAELIDDALDLQAACWPAIERICMLSRAERSGLVMDWWLLDPKSVINAEIPGLEAVWIETDAAVLERRERANGSFFAASGDPGRMFESFLARSTWANGHHPSKARELGFPVIHQPGDRPTDDLVDETLAALAARRSLD